MVGLGKHLGFALPASGLSLVQTEEVEQQQKQPVSKSRNKRIHSQQPSNSTPIQNKKSKIVAEDPNLSEVTPLSETSFNQYNCEKCQKGFNSKYLMKKHIKDCLGPNTELSIDGKEKCNHCGEYFTTQGGWLRKVYYRVPHLIL